MANSTRAYAVEAGGVVPDSELSPAARAIIRRLSQCVYVRDQHRIAIARISREIATLQSELEALEVRP